MSDGSDEPGGFTQNDLAQVWSAVLDAAETDLGPDCVERWLRPLQLEAIEADLARVGAPTAFLADWTERNYGLHLLRGLQRVLPPIRRLDIALSAGAAANGNAARPAPAAKALAARPAAAAPRMAPLGMGEEESAPLDQRFTFETFVVGKPNELAHAAARRVAEGCDTVYNPVFLYGGVGLGKTHLMHAIGHHLARTRPEARVLFLSAEQFMYRFIKALRSHDTMSFKQQLRSVDVLMVDDVQFIARKESTQDEFFHTFNALIELKRQIVISGDRSPDSMEGIEERIRSRLQWGLAVDIHPTDYELRLGVLQQKAEAFRQSTPEVELEPRVIDFLAHRINQNIRVLEGALTRLFAFASLVGRRIDLDMTSECLADLLRNSDRKVSIEDIKRKVCDHYHVRLTDLTSPRRARTIARPRQVAMFLAKMLTSKSLPEIGRGFGGRDHTTVIHAVRKIEQLRETDSQLADDIELLRRMLEA